MLLRPLWLQRGLLLLLLLLWLGRRIRLTVRLCSSSLAFGCSLSLHLLPVVLPLALLALLRLRGQLILWLLPQSFLRRWGHLWMRLWMLWLLPWRLRQLILRMLLLWLL